MKEESSASNTREPEPLELPPTVPQRVAEAEAKRAQQGGDPQATFVRFDPDTRVDEPQAQQPRTEMYSPTFAGDISSSPTSKQEGTSSGSGVVRRAIQGVEL